MFSNQPYHHLSVSPKKEATSFRYYGDGSGRDSYVVTNCGGLIPNYQDPDVSRRFQSSLRHHPINSKKKPTKQDFLVEA